MGSIGGTSVIVDIASLLKAPDSNEASVPSLRQHRPVAVPQPATTPLQKEMPARVATIVAPVSMSGDRRDMLPSSSAEQPVKKQSKWSPDEDAVIIELRGSGMKWEDISKRLPGRSAISCRLHYQNYLERRSEWDEERKNKLARLYERFKAEMWAKVAEELQVPWRAAEAMHWQLGETEMARRAGVVPFSLAAVNAEGGYRNSPIRTLSHPQSQAGSLLDASVSSPQRIYSRLQPVPGIPGVRAMPSRRDTFAIPQPPPPQPPPGPSPAMGPESMDVFRADRTGLPPIQHQPPSGHMGLLPGVMELTTGVSPYNTADMVPGARPLGPVAAEGAYHPNAASYPPTESSRTKRRASPPGEAQREANHRRRMG